jgi:DNA-directed RNA polymerase specialized sigma24 family protein
MVREYGPDVFGAAWRILGRADDAEDVVQEVFGLAQRLRQCQSIAWGPQLRGLAVCRALERLGEQGGAREEDLAARLRLALARLPRQEAAVFCLRHFEHLSFAEVAVALRWSVTAVVAALREAQGRLEQLMVESTPRR